MKILVLGGAGFIGKVLIEKLIIEKYLVHSFDTKLLDLKNPNFKQTQGNISEISNYKKIFKDIDFVFHFAAISSLEYASKNPELTVNTNILSTIKILKLCKANKVKKFFFSSSLYVNGNKGGYYRCSKLASEEYIKEFCEINKLNFIILRFGSVYGRGSGLDNGIHKIINNYFETKKIQYLGNSDSMREYIHVNDIAHSCIYLLKSKKINKIINLSGSQRIKIKDLLLLLSEMLNYRGKIIFKTKKMFGHYKYTAYSIDNDHPEKLSLNYSIDFEEGLKDTIKYIRENK